MPDSKEKELIYSLTYHDVVEILQLINESSSCESLELELGDLRINATRAAPAPAAPAQPERPAVAGEAAAPAQAEGGAGLVAVRSPMLGTFYRAPAPGEPPFIEPGDLVEEDETIGLIDVMKLFTQVTAGAAGRVVEILAQNATLVEYDQPLVLIEPLPSAE